MVPSVQLYSRRPRLLTCWLQWGNGLSSKFQAHTTGIEAMTLSTGTLVTASETLVRVWATDDGELLPTYHFP